MKKYLAACGASILIAACAPVDGTYSNSSRAGISKKDIGAISGMVIGGSIANDLSYNSKNKGLTTVLGAFIGGVLGQSIGAQLDEADKKMVSGAYRQALESTPSNESVTWDNPDSGNYGSFTPVRTYQDNRGYCREYSQEIVIGGKQQAAYGTACRQPDGSWQIQK